MRTLGTVSLVSLAVAGLCGPLAAAEPSIITCAQRVSSFIDAIHLGERFAANSKILASKGYSAEWSNAIAGERKAIETGVEIRLKIFAVPFINSRGEIKDSIIGGVIQSGDGAQIYEFITVAVIADDKDIIIPADIKSGIGEAIPDIDIKPLLSSIDAGRRSEIWDYIFRSPAINVADSGGSIRAAFEISGFYCSDAPIWFPQKSIWYATTCIRKAQ